MEECAMGVRATQRLKRRLVTALELPKDVALGLPVTTMMGNEEVFVSNHKGLLEYGAGHIRLATAVGKIKIFGSNMILKEITAESVSIKGRVEKIIWEA